MCTAQQFLIDKLGIEELFLRQKSIIKWISKGDRSIYFVHQSVKIKKPWLHFHKVKNQAGSWITNIDDITIEGIQTYQAQQNGDHVYVGIDMLDAILQIITEVQNESLSAFPTINEIHSVVKSMNGDCSTGPDGFNVHFHMMGHN